MKNKFKSNDKIFRDWLISTVILIVLSVIIYISTEKDSFLSWLSSSVGFTSPIISICIALIVDNHRFNKTLSFGTKPYTDRLNSSNFKPSVETEEEPQREIKTSIKPQEPKKESKFNKFLRWLGHTYFIFLFSIIICYISAQFEAADFFCGISGINTLLSPALSFFTMKLADIFWSRKTPPTDTEQTAKINSTNIKPSVEMEAEPQKEIKPSIKPQKPKKDSIFNKLSLINRRNKKLQEKIDSLQAMLSPEAQSLVKLQDEFEELTQKKSETEEELKDLIKQSDTISKELQDNKNNLTDLKSQIIEVTNTIETQEYGLYTPTYVFANSDLYADKLKEIRTNQKTSIRNGTACKSSTTWTVNNSQAQGRKIVNDMMKLLLRAFNLECDDIINNVKISNFDKSKEKNS